MSFKQSKKWNSMVTWSGQCLVSGPLQNCMWSQKCQNFLQMVGYYASILSHSILMMRLERTSPLSFWDLCLISADPHFMTPVNSFFKLCLVSAMYIFQAMYQETRKSPHSESMDIDC